MTTHPAGQRGGKALFQVSGFPEPNLSVPEIERLPEHWRTAMEMFERYTPKR